jgi:murein DD-endopeptidase / murein LD-carboxypeptidase
MIGGELAAAKALRAIGTPFRLHGRQPGIAFDCVGLVSHAIGLSDVPSRYSLKGEYCESIKTYLDSCFASKPSPDAAPINGDVAVVRCSPAQSHLMIRAGNGWVHAHAGLRRVVHTPDPSPWPIIALWRIEGG